VKLVIEGAPRTKKNHGRRIYSFAHRRSFNVPSEAHEEWAMAAARQLRVAWKGRPAMKVHVHVRAIFYREADVGDLCGYKQALGDVLEAPTKKTSMSGRAKKASVIINDVQIRSWDGSRLRKDAEWPRVELEITKFEEENEA
jgi:hypothetical protein